MFFWVGGSKEWVRAGWVWVCVGGSETNGKNGKNGMRSIKPLIHNDLAFSVFIPFFIPFSVPFSVWWCDRWRVLCGAGST